jgi:hypothetical protein
MERSVSLGFVNTYEVRKHTWSDIAYQRKFFDQAQTQLGIKHMDDWYTVKTQELYDIGKQHFNRINLV